MTKTLFSPAKLGALDLQNHVVMAPMTRSRAGQHDAPTVLAAEYYEQRAGAGLIITEGTSPSRNGQGYSHIPGMWNDDQVKGWSDVTKRVHARGAKIFVQLMHTGRVSHPFNMPVDAEVLAPSAIRLDEGKMMTDKGPQDYPVPKAMSEAQIEAALVEHALAAKNAIRAGFDGVELHGANGYLSEQFFNPHSNTRTDAWGGSVANRARFALEAVKRMAEAIGKERVGVRVSPYGVASGMKPYPEVDETYRHLADELATIGIVYMHVVDHSAMGAPPVPASIKATIRRHFKGAYIAAGGFDRDSAQQMLDENKADLVAFGRPFIANPDLVERMNNGWELAKPDMSTAYTPGPKGYIDYPPHKA